MKIKTRFVCWLSALLSAVPAVGLRAGDTLSLAVLGIRPNTYANCVAQVQEALRQCRQRHCRVLRFEAGRYDFWPEGASRRELFVSNTSSETECPSKEKVIGLLLEEMADLTIDGGGATFVFHGKMTMLAMLHCKRIGLRNVHFDFERPGGSEFAYTRVTPDSVELRAHPDTRYAVDGGRVALYGEGWKTNVDHCVKFNPATDRFAYSRDWRLLSASEATEVAPGLLRFPRPAGLEPKEGEVLTIRDIIRDQVGMLILESEDISFSDVSVHYMHGLGIVSQYSRNVTMERLHCEPRAGSGRVLASSADFLHFSGCSGRIVVRDGRFSGAQDDCINVHGTTLRVDSVLAENRLRVRFMHHQSYGFNAFFANDTVAFVAPATMQRFATAVVKGVLRVSDRVVELTLDRAVPRSLRVGSDCVENLTCTPEVEIRNNLFTHTSTRGTLVTTPRRVVIAGNTYRSTGMSAILIEADAAGWFESGPVKDVLIDDNDFIDCAPNGHPEHAVIAVNPSNTVVDAKTPVHFNIRILHNRFKTWGNPVLFAKSVRGLEVAGNRVASPDGGTMKAQELYRLSGCSRVKIGNNRQMGL